MGRVLTLLSVILLAVVDLVTFLLLFILPVDKEDARKEMTSFEFSSSTFDLLLWSCLRFCMLIGCCCAVVFNASAAVNRIKNSSRLPIYLGCAQSIYCVMKIMYFTTDGHLDTRAWLMIGICLFTSITQYAGWEILGNVSVSAMSSRKVKLLSVNANSFVYNNTLSSGSNISHEKDGVDGNDSDKDDEESDDDGDTNDKDRCNRLDRKEAKKYKTFGTVLKLFKLAKDDALYLLLAFVFLVCCSTGEIFLPFYTGEVINYIVIDKSTEKFQGAMLYMALITLATGLASGMRGGTFHYVYARYDFRIQTLLFERIMQMEIGFFDMRKTGEITSRLTSDCTKIGDGITYNLNVFLRSAVKIIGILFFMFKLSWRLSIVTLISIPIVAILSEVFGEAYRKLSEKVQNSLAYANETAEEVISSMRTVRSFAGEDEETKRYSDRLKKTYKLRVKESVLICLYRWATELTELAMTLVILYFGGHLVIQGRLSGGHLVSFILYSIEIGYAFDSIGDVYTGLMEAVGASKNVLVYIERKPEVKNDGTFEPDSGIAGNVEFRHVSFAYPSRVDIPVLHDINFSISKGEVVALVGPSGGGKSSIVNLLEHFYETTNGHVLIDNIDVRRYDHKFIHSNVSLVQQEPVLFARTISDNISYGMQKPIAKDLIVNTAKMANAHEFVSVMPNAYETETGERGIQLSGGQKQRIAIGRALIRNPSILLLDEATSALDSESEHLVQQAINRNLSGRSVLVIAHRLSTVEKADKIIVIDKGKIVEMGKHHELIQNSGVYAGLVKRQLLGASDEKKCEERSIEGSPSKQMKDNLSSSMASHSYDSSSNRKNV